MKLLLVVFALLLAPCVSSTDASEAFIGVLSNDSTLLIQPPQGGFVSIVNLTDLSSIKSDLSSALVRVTSSEAELSSTRSDLSSALVRMNRTEELLFSALSSALNRISALETAQSPCKKK